MKNRILIFNLLSFIFLVLTFCTSSTEIQTGSLTGNINLEGQTVHSGIVIGIYELVELDPDIVEVNTQWPHIGVIINQHTEFDHRFGTLVKTGETDASGYFEITDIPTGVYNVVAIKDGFGFRYIYNVNINNGTTYLENIVNIDLSRRSVTETEGNNELIEKNKEQRSKIKENQTQANNFSLSSLVFDLDNRNSDLTLFPETIISPDISPTVFESFHHYIIEQDITIDDELTIEPGAVVRLNYGVRLTITDKLTANGTEDNYIWFTSNDSLFSLFPSPISRDEIALYNRVELTGSQDKSVSFCKFTHANTGLLSHVNGFEITNSIFRNSNCGFKAENADSAFCRNLLCEAINNEEQGGIYYLQVADGLIEKNIVNDCENGMKIKNGSSPEIENNFIYDNSKGIYVCYGSNSDIYNNEFVNCLIGIYLCWNSYSYITYNNFSNDICVKINWSLYSVPSINFNNLKTTNNFALYYGNCNGINSNNLDATSNYFYTTNYNVIAESIYDKNDVEPSQQQYYGEVDFEPFLTQEYPYAGIQGE